MHNKTLNKTLPQSQLLEGLQYKDLDGMIKPTVHVDEFASKMGDDEDIIVLSFFVRSKQAAKDLMAWFEKGYDFVLDADCSPGEVKPNRFLVYVELRRRNAASEQVAELLDDLSTLTEHNANDWTMHYDGKDVEFSPEEFAKLVPLTPKDYARQTDQDLNEMRIAAGIDTKKIYKVDSELRALQAAAGI